MCKGGMDNDEEEFEEVEDEQQSLTMKKGFDNDEEECHP